MSKTTVYIFAGCFKDRATACLYSEPQWQPEPDASASDEVYQQWEDNNPTHQLRQHFNTYLDTDFIETVEKDMTYLASLNITQSCIEDIERKTAAMNILILVFADALGRRALHKAPISTPHAVLRAVCLYFIG